MKRLIVALMMAGLLMLAAVVPAFAAAHDRVPIECNGTTNGPTVTTTPVEAEVACPHLFGGGSAAD